MSKKVLGILALFLVITFSLIPFGNASAASLNTYTGIVGTEITVVSLVEGNTFTILWDGTAIKSGTVNSGNYTYFSVPETYGGTHTISVESPTGTPVYSGTFTVSPHLVIDPTYGIVGTTITVTGHGFGVSEANIAVSVNSNTVQSGITASSVGYWSTTIAAPAAARGNSSIDAYGATTTATNVANKDFAISPSVKMDPTSGGVGSAVTITASGFAASENGIKVLYSGKEVRSGLIADATGSWSTSFSVPNSTKGTHLVNIYGYTTPQKDITDLIYTVAPSLSISPDNGVVDDTIKVTGSGFFNNETGISVLFDDAQIQSGITADDTGFWTSTVKIPATSAGSHSIKANGRLTSASDVTAANFNIQTLLSIVPKTGNVGDEVRVTGSGFSSNKDFTLMFDNTIVTTGITLDTGIFQTTFKTPGGKSGTVNVVATDAKGVTSTAVYTMESTPPSIPSTLTPKDGSTIGVMGETKVTFRWVAVNDPSGVTYDLEVSDDSGFARKLISRTNMTMAVYTTSEAEMLNNGEYYWRVRAVDGAGNTSAWSEVSTLKVGFITMGTIIGVIVTIVVILIAVLVIRNFMKPKKKDEFDFI